MGREFKRFLMEKKKRKKKKKRTKKKKKKKKMNKVKEKYYPSLFKNKGENTDNVGERKRKDKVRARLGKNRLWSGADPNELIISAKKGIRKIETRTINSRIFSRSVVGCCINHRWKRRRLLRKLKKRVQRTGR